jgi:hypothetical protein
MDIFRSFPLLLLILSRLHRQAESIANLDRCVKIRLIENNAKCCYIKIFTCKGTLRQVFICMRPPPLLGFCLGWCSNFVGSESG